MTARGPAIDDSPVSKKRVPVPRTYPSRFVATGRPDQHGMFRIPGLPAGTSLAVAVDYISDGAWTDPAYLERLAPLATRIELRWGQSATVTLEVVQGR